MDERKPGPQIVPDIDVRTNVLAELRFAFRKAEGILSEFDRRLRASRSVAEQEQIGTEIEGFIRRLALGALALGDPSGAGVEAGRGSMKGSDKR